MFYGQHHEDERIVRLLGPCDLTRSYFYEFGGNSPHVDSISKYFYDRGAIGVMCEPIVHWWKQHVENRVRDVNLNCAVGEFAEEARTIYAVAGTGLSTLVSGKTFEPYENYTATVQVRTIADIYEQYPCPPGRSLDFMIMDIEGFEIQAIRGADWDRFHPKVLCIEADHGHEEWEPLIIAAGYRYVDSDPANRFFISTR